MNWFDKIVTKIGLDKIAHMFIIAFVATILAMIFYKTTPGYSSWTYAASGLFGGIVVAILKKVCDFFYRKRFDLKDILWGAIGGIIAFLSIGIFM